MSAINGDKSRFHRERKQKIARRKRTRELLNMVTAQSRSKARGVAKSAKESVVSA
jgi:predicted lactoylglutathione lyase